MSFTRRFAAGMVVAVVAVLATAAPASAHDELVSSTPAVDERLAEAPESITMRFSGKLLALSDSMPGAIVIVIDADGRDWATGDVEVAADEVTAAVEPGMPEGGYQVRWQVVSEDGHTVAGVVPFTIGEAAPLVSSSAETGGGLPVDEEIRDQNAQELSGAVRVLLIGAGGAALAVAAFALYRFLRRRTTASAPSSSEEQAE